MTILLYFLNILDFSFHTYSSNSPEIIFSSFLAQCEREISIHIFLYGQSIAPGILNSILFPHNLLSDENQVFLYS